MGSFSAALRRLPGARTMARLAVVVALSLVLVAVSAPTVSVALPIQADDTSSTTTPVATETTAQETTGVETTPPSTEPTSTTVAETSVVETTVAETSVPPGGETPSTTADITQAPSSAPENQTTTTSAAGETTLSVESSETTLDPAVNEAQREDDADGDVTVPPAKTFGSQGDPTGAGILWSSVRDAEARYGELQGQLAIHILEVRALRLRRKQLDVTIASLESETEQTYNDAVEATDRMKRRSIAAFTRAGSTESEIEGPSLLDALQGHERSDQERRRSQMARAALRIDEVQIEQLHKTRSALGEDAQDLFERSSAVDELLGYATATVLEARVERDQAQIELEAFKAGSEVYIEGVVFPIQGAYGLPLIDSFGFPRMPGTADEHWHEGIDIFAPRGTPLVATERGVLSKVGSNRLGGVRLWLTGQSGSEWYYAHLDSIAGGITNGLVVEAGDLLGYVGNSGNAIGTPPHLHMELHPDGGRAVNPYPLLAVVSAMERQALAEGIVPARQYEPVVTEQPETTTTLVDESPSSTSSTSDTVAPATTNASSSTTVDGSVETSMPETTAPPSDNEVSTTGSTMASTETSAPTTTTDTSVSDTSASETTAPAGQEASSTSNTSGVGG